MDSMTPGNTTAAIALRLARAEAVRVALARAFDRIGERKPTDKPPLEFAKELLEAVYGTEERGA